MARKKTITNKQLADAELQGSETADSLRKKIIDEAGNEFADRLIRRLKSGRGGFEVERSLLPRLLPAPPPSQKYVKLNLPRNATLGELSRFILRAMCQQKIGVEIATQVSGMLLTIAKIEKIERDNDAADQMCELEAQFEAVRDHLLSVGIELPHFRKSALENLASKNDQASRH